MAKVRPGQRAAVRAKTCAGELLSVIAILNR
jgi:hypothetical protein